MVFRLTGLPRYAQRSLALGCSTVFTTCVILLAFCFWRRAPETVDVRFADHSEYTALADVPTIDRTGLAWRPLTEVEVRRFYPELSTLVEYDAFCLYRHRGSIDTGMSFPEHPRGEIAVQTNRAGLRETAEVAQVHPSIRILITGDSHTDGVCEVEETFTNVLERRISEMHPRWTIEALNAGCGGYSFYNYLGVLKRFSPLRPDVFVVTVFGGNDFSDILLLQAAFEGRMAPPSHAAFRSQIARAESLWSNGVHQGLVSARYFSEYPEEIDDAIRGSFAVSRQIVAECQDAGTAPVFVYLPPLHDVQWDSYADELDGASDALGLRAEDVHVLDAIADRYLSALRGVDAAVVDLRPVFRGEITPMYWRSDGHINVAGHARVAEALLGTIERLIRGPSRHAGSATAAIPEATPMPTWKEHFRELDDDPLPRLSFTRDEVEHIISLTDPIEYDPALILRLRSSLTPPSASTVAGTRIVVLGDDFAWGRKEDGPSMGTILASTLRTLDASTNYDCIDRTTPGGSVHTALVAARSPELAAVDVIVLLVGAGSDFLDACRILKLSQGRPIPGLRPATPLDSDSQWLDAILYFHDKPRAVREAVRAVARATAQLAVECGSRDQRLVVVMAPAASNSRCDNLAATIKDALARNGIDDSQRRVLDRMAEILACYLRDRAVETIDFAETWDVRCPFEKDSLRLSSEGRRALARAIAASVQSGR